LQLSLAVKGTLAQEVAPITTIGLLARTIVPDTSWVEYLSLVFEDAPIWMTSMRLSSILPVSLALTENTAISSPAVSLRGIHSTSVSFSVAMTLK
jgi:hypothetical protein